MNVVFFSPGFPVEMPRFVRGLASLGVRVIGLGDQPAAALAPEARSSLYDYLRVRNMWDVEVVGAELERLHRRLPIDRIECLWEPGMLLAARLRERLGLPGMTVEETTPFRDKEEMKRRLDAAGVRTPRHVKATSPDEVDAGAERVGYPLIVKPIAGAGSADTYRVDGPEDLERVKKLTAHIPEVSVEEFIEGEEHTFDTICSGGEIHYFNVAWYRPPPLIARTNEWISPQTVTLRDVSKPHIEAGVEMGKKVLEALGFRTGFTHMEWFSTPSGEAIFGEIGARPPGARSVDLMNYGCDLDVYRGWGEAIARGSFSQPVERKYNAAIVFKRAHGQGRIRRIDGLERLLHDFGDAVTCVDLLPVGAPRRNWKQTLVSDGYLIVRHPDLDRTVAMADRVGEELQLYAGG